MEAHTCAFMARRPGEERRRRKRRRSLS